MTLCIRNAKESQETRFICQIASSKVSRVDKEVEVLFVVFSILSPPPFFFKENLQLLSLSLTEHCLKQIWDIFFLFFNINTHLKIHMLGISYILKDD